jgi:hypothetical protein
MRISVSHLIQEVPPRVPALRREQRLGLHPGKRFVRHDIGQANPNFDPLIRP